MRLKEHICWLVAMITFTFICAFGAERVVTYDTTTGKTKATVSNSAQLEAAIGPLSAEETDPIASAVSGILKSDGTTLSAATVNVDYAPGSTYTIVNGNHANWTANSAIVNGNHAAWTAKADYEFGSNNFNGTGNFTTTGIGQLASLKQTGITQVSVYGNGDQAFDDNTWTKIALQNENLDTLNEFDSTTNYRFTATKNSTYLVYGVVAFEGVADGKDCFCAISVNGTRTYLNGLRASSPTGTARAIISVFSIFPLTIGQYLEFEGYQNTGGSANSATGQFAPNFYVQALNQN